jgi:penicillin amidase
MEVCAFHRTVHPLGVLPLIGRFFNVGSFPVPVGQETINNLDFPLDSTGSYKVVSGPALRRIPDFGDLSQRTSINPVAQSGYFMCPCYDDQSKLFNEDGTRPDLLDRKSVEKVMIGNTFMRP